MLAWKSGYPSAQPYPELAIATNFPFEVNGLPSSPCTQKSNKHSEDLRYDSWIISLTLQAPCPFLFKVQTCPMWINFPILRRFLQSLNEIDFNCIFCKERVATSPSTKPHPADRASENVHCEWIEEISSGWKHSLNNKVCPAAMFSGLRSIGLTRSLYSSGVANLINAISLAKCGLKYLGWRTIFSNLYSWLLLATSLVPTTTLKRVMFSL